MNENINLVEILKDYPKGTILYSPICGNCILQEIVEDSIYPIETKPTDFEGDFSFTIDGKHLAKEVGECILFPSKEQKDWSKFNIKNGK